MKKLSDDQQEQWRAFHQFHEQYTTADSVPTLPITVSSPSGSSFDIQHGTPFDWNTAWSKVAWRYDRPHKPQSTGPPQAEQQLEQPPPTNPLPAALVNKATGANAPKLAKKHAAIYHAVLEEAHKLPPKGNPSASKGQLCFAVLPEPDGEFYVGLVRIEQCVNGIVDYVWWQRKSESHLWADTPTFDPFMPKGKVEKQTGVDQEALLPVPVSLTPASAIAYNPQAKSIAGQTVRLTKACITLLRAFVADQRSDLLGADADSSEEDTNK